MSSFMTELKETLRRQTWIDEYAEPLQKAVHGLYEKTGHAGQIAANFFNGTWLGHPLHPVLTDVPLGAWLTAVLLDQMHLMSPRKGIARSADAAVTLGVVGAVGAAAAGLTDWQHLTGESRRTGFVHAALNTLALTFFIGSMISRKNKARSAGRGLALLGLGMAGASAYLGGDLTFRQKIGVNHAPEEIDAPKFKAVISLSDLPEDQPTRAMLGEMPILLVRSGEQVFALAETCAHLGAPLSEGKLSEDSQGRLSIVCPWHASTFEISTGDVLRGPSAYPQPCFETRIRSGQVEIRHRSQ